MSDQPRLSELCSICNSNTSKYRCPACSARTCSLPCYKRHQQWGQCSGLRDATKFVKKSQLATPAGIDHDFNFLTSIERGIEKAEKTVSASRPSAPRQNQPIDKGRVQHREVPYGRLEAMTGVKIVRAPKGLSRQTENKTHPSSTKKAKNNVVWTVEWINDANKHVRTETSSTAALAAAHPFGSHKGKKRKLGPDIGSPSLPNTSLQHVSTTTANQNKPVKSLEQVEQVKHQLPLDNKQQPEHPSSRRRASHPTQEEVVEATQGKGNLANANTANTLHDGSISQPLGHEQYRFFLLKPRTTSTRHVLIPLTPSATLAECLHGRTVLEFPTIYAFPSTMEQLPTDCMLEEDYAKQEGEEQREFDELMGQLDPDMLRRLKEDRLPANAEKEEEVDSKKILDVLKRDLGAEI